MKRKRDEPKSRERARAVLLSGSGAPYRTGGTPTGAPFPDSTVFLLAARRAKIPPNAKPFFKKAGRTLPVFLMKRKRDEPKSRIPPGTKKIAKGRAGLPGPFTRKGNKKMTHYRTHTCGQLRAADAGKTVTLAGWMENVREVGSNFAFVVLRDFYGTTQIVVQSAEAMKIVKSINKESTIAVTGAVRLRESPNPKLPTGEIEVVPEKIEVLGRCRYNELPFEINRSREADESARLKR